MRILLNHAERNSYFRTLKNKATTSWKDIASVLHVTSSTLRAYRTGECTIPKKIGDQIQKIYRISIPEKSIIKNDYWHTKTAGNKGAVNRYKLYGNPGTREGRKKGGLHSLKSRKMVSTKFKFRKTMQRSEEHTSELQ